jgi:quercetin dioxygenase-like cupin family protein
MKVLSTRGFRLALMAMALSALFVALNAVPGGATGANGVTGVKLAQGTNTSQGTIPIKQGLNIFVFNNTFGTGATSGWHSHPGGAIVVVTAGTITFHRAAGNNCETTIYTTGDAYTERPGEVVMAENLSTTVTASVIVTYPSVPGTAFRTDEPAPSCA